MSNTDQDITRFIDGHIDNVAGAGKEHLLQLLIAVQQRFRFIPPIAIEILSQRLSVSPVDIDSIISFYAFLITEDPGAYHILISDNTTDRMAGNQQLSHLPCL